MSVRILAVDDEKLNCDLVSRTFQGDPRYELTIALSAAEALQQCAAQKFDLFLIDQSMPGMTGTELVDVLWQNGLKPLVVMLTAYPELKQVIDAWQQGRVRSVISKPWRAADLVQAVERA